MIYVVFAQDDIIAYFFFFLPITAEMNVLSVQYRDDKKGFGR